MTSRRASFDVLGHAGGVAADVEVGAALEPGVELGGVLLHAVLDVDLVGLVAGEGGVEAGEEAVLVHGEELVFVEEVEGAALLAEEEPVVAGVRRWPGGASRKARKGAMPVPGPIMMTGAVVSSGRRKLLFACRKMGMVAPTGARSPRWPLARPWRSRPWAS